MRILILSIVILISKVVSSQSIEFGFAIDQIIDDYDTDIRTDVQGNIYASSSFWGSVDFDPSPNSDIRVVSGVGTDIFLVKYNPKGQLLWCKTFGGQYRDESREMIIDDSANIYIVGYFEGSVDFDPDTGINIHTSAGDQDAFISKFDTSGKYLWTITFGYYLMDIIGGIRVNSSGELLVNGVFEGTVDFDPDTSVFNLSSTPFQDSYFFAKYSKNGNLIWAKSLGGIGSSSRGIHLNLELTSKDELILTGICNSCDFDPGTGVVIGSGYTSYIAKYDTLGQFIWLKELKDTSSLVSSDLRIADLELDENDNIVICGTLHNDVDMDPGPNVQVLTTTGLHDIFLARYDSLGNYQWAYNFGNINFDWGRSLKIDNQGNINLYGSADGTIDFDPGPGTATTLGTGSEDGFWAKYSKSGIYMNSFRFDSPLFDGAASIWIDEKFSIYLMGNFRDSLDLDPTSAGYIINANTFYSGYIAKYSQCVDPEIGMLVADPSPQCIGDSITLKLTNSFINSANDWQWYHTSCGGGFIGTGDSIKLSIDSVFSVFVRGEGGCQVTNACDSILLIPNDTKAPDLTCPTDSTFIIPESESTYLVKSLNANAIDNCSEVDLSWTMSGATTGSGSGNINNFTFNLGTTLVSFSAIDTSLNQSNCSFNINVSHPTGINNFNLSSIKIFPNPSNGTFRIQNAPIENLEVRDLLGRSIDFNLTQKSNFAELTINSSSGIYLAFIYSQNERLIKRLVIN